MHSITTTISPVHGVMLLTWFCKIDARLELSDGHFSDRCWLIESTEWDKPTTGRSMGPSHSTSTLIQMGCNSNEATVDMRMIRILQIEASTKICDYAQTFRSIKRAYPSPFPPHYTGGCMNLRTMFLAMHCAKYRQVAYT